MTEVVQYTVRGNRSVLVEIDSDPYASVPAGRNGRVRELRTAFESRLADVREAAEAALLELRKDIDPDELKLSFGIKLTGELGAVVARSAVEGNLSVELVWKKSPS
jgi:hypothetical protein